MCWVFSDSGLAELGCRPAAESGARSQAGSVHAALSFLLVVPEVEVEKLIIQGQTLLFCAEVLRSKLLSERSSAKAWDNGWGGKWRHWGHRECLHAGFSLPLPSLKNHEKQIGIYCCHSLWYFWHIDFPTLSIDFHWPDPYTEGRGTCNWGGPCHKSSRHWVLSDSTLPPGREELLDFPGSRFWLCLLLVVKL